MRGETNITSVQMGGVQEEVNKNGIAEASMTTGTSYTLSYTGITCFLAVGTGIYMLGMYSAALNVIVNDPNVSITWVSKKHWTVTNNSTSSTGKPLKAFAAGVSLVQATT